MGKDKNLFTKFYYMTDDFSFIDIEGDTIKDKALHGARLAIEEPHGMICPALVVDEETGDTIDRLGSSLHSNPHEEFDIHGWIDHLTEALKKYPDITFK